jgi:hypothetical protein
MCSGFLLTMFAFIRRRYCPSRECCGFFVQLCLIIVFFAVGSWTTGFFNCNLAFAMFESCATDVDTKAICLQNQGFKNLFFGTLSGFIVPCIVGLCLVILFLCPGETWRWLGKQRTLYRQSVDEGNATINVEQSDSSVSVT